MSTNIRVAANPYKRVFVTADATTSSFTALTPVSSQPATDGIIQFAPYSKLANGQTIDNKIKFVFFGTGVNNATLQAQIVYWTNLAGTNSFTAQTNTLDLWVPEIVCNVDVTLSALTGVASTYIDSSHRIADTITLTAATSNIASNAIISPANDTVASITMDLLGAQLVEVLIKLGTATAANAIYKTY